jgi:hypothetical protein
LSAATGSTSFTHHGPTMAPSRLAIPMRARRLWKAGVDYPVDGSVHVSMNDYMVHRLRDVPLVVLEGMRFRRAWPTTDGALGLWMAAFNHGFRQVSVSIWRSTDDLQSFVRSPAHTRVMRAFRDAGDLYTSSWAANRFDRLTIWHQAEDRLAGRVPDVPHH